MRGLQLLCLILLFSALALGQMGRPYPGPQGCFYGCAPFIPLVSTPMISFQTVSSNPVGATNATGGLTAGATNSTMESLPVDPNTDRTQVVWYWGANTVPTAATEEALMPPMHHGIMEHTAHVEHMTHMEHLAQMEHHAEEGPIFIAGPVESESVMESAAGSKNSRKATRTITNQDVDQLNQKTGTVKYDGKTEKLQ